MGCQSNRRQAGRNRAEREPTAVLKANRDLRLLARLAPAAPASSTSWTALGTMARVQQSIVTLDMEGVLTPEIWIAVAEKTGIPELRRTTRDEPDYDVLMRGRLALLAHHGLKLSDVQAVIGSLHPLEGAVEFLDELRSITQVIVLSDTFEQFAQPFLRQMGWPTLFCHRLVIEKDRITDYRLRVPDQKRQAVAALRGINYRVIAAGDSYNDTSMLKEADVGFLFRAPANVKAEFPQFSACDEYGELLHAIRGALEQSSTL